MLGYRRNSSMIRIITGAVLLVLLTLLSYSAYLAFSENAGPAGVIGGKFALVDQNGRAVTDQSFHGHWLVIYFGYSRCPDECPEALNHIANALAQIGDKRKQVVPIFITVDPARDTAKVLKDYVENFGPDFVGLTGSDAAIAGAEQAYHVYAAKHPEANGNYDMDHSSIIYIMDPTGRFATNFTGDTDSNTIAARLKALVS